ncbi:WD40 repeat-like protein [Piedraia hortae CBS 480.64]|uniref:WD40 repeat-like protein n=1 Tax=Piedraia hortae CBS 480.64 TaxID=1314780 RepID=A0A6A7C9I8_9PEZI|nr:WD40 repeat-like protein [Piedraia hortae CBS 480.64]
MTHFLHWIETMSWLGEVHEVCGILNQVLTHAFSKHQTHDLKVFLDDAKQWIRAFANAINILPLQTYLYALIGSPSNSVLRARFKHVIERSTDICVTPNEGWNVLALSPPFIAGISSVAISEAGNTVAASLDNGYVCLWDVDLDTSEDLYCVDEDEDHIQKLFFTPSGDELVSISSDCVRMINVKTKSEQVLFGKRTHPDSIVGITQNLQLVALESEDHIVLHDVKTNEESFRISQNVGQHSPVIFSPDGGMLAFTSSDYSVRVWSTQSREEMSVLPGGSSHVQCLAFSPDGSRLASGDEDGTVRVWDTNTWSQTEMRELRGSPSQLAFTPRGEGLVVSFVKETGYDLLAMGESEWFNCDVRRTISAIASSSGSNKMVIGQYDGQLVIHDLSDELTRLQSQAFLSEITAMTALADGHTIAIGMKGVSLQLLDIEKVPHQGRVLEGHTDYVTVMKLSPDGRKLATGSDDKSVRLWDTDQAVQVSVMVGHSSWVTALAFSPDGDRIASGSDDRTVRVWNARTGNQESIFTEHLAALRTVTFSPNGSTVASGDKDGSARLWSAKDGNHISSSTRDDAIATCNEDVNFDEDPFTRVDKNVFSEDGCSVATLSSGSDQNHAVRVWDARTGDLKSIILGLMFPPAVSFSPAGKVVVAGQWTRTAWRWRAKIETLDFDLYWPNGQAVVRAPFSENHVEDGQNVEPSVGQWFEAHYPEFPVYKPNFCTTFPPWNIRKNWASYGGCDVFPSSYPVLLYHAFWEDSIVFGVDVDKLTVIRFKSEWLAKVRELQQYCYCAERWIEDPPFRPLRDDDSDAEEGPSETTYSEEEGPPEVSQSNGDSSTEDR